MNIKVGDMCITKPNTTDDFQEILNNLVQSIDDEYEFLLTPEILTVTEISSSTLSEVCIVDQYNKTWSINKIDKILTKEEYPEYYL